MKRIASLLLVLAMVFSLVNLTVFAADASVLVDVTNQVVTENSRYEYTWTVEKAGTLTVEASGSPAWRYQIFYPDGTATLNQKINKSWDLTQTGTYTVKVGAYHNTDFSYTDGTVGLKLTFAPAEVGEDVSVPKKPYQIAGTALQLGNNTVAMEETAVTTIYEFKPTEVGIYTITSPAGTYAGNWGSGSWFLQDPKSTSNVVQWTCTAVGQCAYIGVSGAEGTINLHAAKTGEYEVIVYEEVVYENKAEVSPFTLPAGAQLGDYVNTKGVHDAILGADGYYHLDAADGPILLVDLNYQDIILTAKLQSDIPTMYIYTKEKLPNGHYIRYSIVEAIQEYEAAMDGDGYYPLTEDLILFYGTYAINQGVYSYHVAESYNPDTVWMYCMRTVDRLDETGECLHTDLRYVDNGNNTHRQVCTCGKVMSGDVPHSYVDNACVCGHSLLNVETAATLKAMLQLDFIIDTADLTGTDNYAIITRTYADGRASETVRVDQKDWVKYDTDTKMQASYTNISAKEMGDEVTVVFYSAAGQQLTVPKTDSIKAYAFRGLEMLQDTADAKEKILRSVLVDMLHYGAAAQKYFRYDTANLVDQGLTAAQKAWATQTDVTVENHRVMDEAGYGSALTLKSAIQLDFLFYKTAIGTDFTGMYAVATYTDHYGKPQSVTVEGKDFTFYDTAKNYPQISVVDMAVADYQSLVTCTVYDASGKVVAVTTDSMESYVRRALDSGKADAALTELCGKLMKFSASADAYFQ